MKPASRNLIFIPAVVWLATCVAPTPGVLLRSTPAAAAPAAAVAPAPATTSPAGRSVVRDLLAFGTDQRLWSADVIPTAGRDGAPGGTRTFLRVRGPGDAQWRLIGELQAAALSLAHRGTELLVVLEGGDWKIVSDSGIRSGIPLPGGAEVIALAGNGDDIWAIGAARQGAAVPATTAGASAAATTAPATTTAATAGAPAPPRATTATATATASATAACFPPPAPPLGVYLLRRGDWSLRDSLPPGLERDDLNDVSLAVLDGRLMLAAAGSDGAVRVFTRRGEKAGWDKGVDVAVAAPGRTQVRLLDLRWRPALWVAAPGGAGSLYLAGEQWQGPIRLTPSPKLAHFDRTALATGLGQLRLLASDGKGKLAEQNYNEDGTLSGEAIEAVTAPTAIDNRVAQLIQMFVVAVLFIWMMGALRQRPETQEAAKRVDQLNLAPLGRRVIGGLIDLLPILIGAFVASQFPAAPAGAAGAGADAAAAYASPQMAWLTAGIGIYLLHTTAFELLFARSLGKFATGTRVAALDGTRPAALPLLTRNLLRIVDIVLVFPPIFVFFSPLRQRVGDMAAGTLVVMNTPTEPLTDADEVAGEDKATPNPPPPTAGGAN